MEDDNHRAKSMVFIHSALDDYGLSMAQFRIFCRIARRGGCYESLPSMAKACRMNDDTARTAMKFLEARRLVVKTRRPGQTSLLSINPFRAWLPSDSDHDGGKTIEPTRKEGAGGNETTPSDSDGCTPKRGGDHPTQKGGHKGNPSEGNPIKGVEPPRVLFELPRFEPLSKTIYLKEGKELKRRIQERIDLIKGDPKATELVTLKSPMGTEYQAKRLKPEAADCVKAYIERIQEITRKESGIIE